MRVYLNGEGRSIHLSRMFNIVSDSTVRKWVNAYLAIGEKRLERELNNKAFVIQFGCLKFLVKNR